jgi:hypothetical protein
VVPRVLFRLRTRDSLIEGVRHTVQLTMSPTERDRQQANLPASLTPFYILLRPFRLLHEYGLGIRRRQK